MNSPRPHPGLDVGQAVREGWEAFGRAPGLFVGFTLLLTALQLLLQSLHPPFALDKLPPLSVEAVLNNWVELLPKVRFATVAIGLFVLTSLVGVVVNLWGTCGLVRAAWVALGGGQPSVATFLRWDPRALVRLYMPGFLLGCGVTVAVVLLVLLAVVLSRVQALLTLLPGLLLLVGATWLSVSQSFLPQVALLHDDHPFDALAQGPTVVDPQWPQVVALITLNSVLVLAGFLLCGLGLFVAIPLVTCVATAAYRQLFGPEDRTGFTRGWP